MRKFKITVNGNVYEVEVEELAADATAAAAPAVQSAPAAPVQAPKAAPAQAPKAAPKAAASGSGSIKITAPMPGNIMSVNVAAGQAVKKGDILCVLEAMKMENEILAPQDATVASVNTTKGSSVNSGDLLFTLN